MTTITNALLCSDTNDAFRAAFGTIARHALPFMAPDAYFTDLLHDAAQAAALAEEGRFYILVRRLGTHVYAYPDDAIDYLPKTDGVAVLRVIRKRYNTFDVTVVHVDPDRATLYGVKPVMVGV
jgi:hypothetical protein